MQLKNIPRNSLLFTKRVVYRNAISYPFLSGDAFSNCADLNLSSSRSFNTDRREISTAKVIFCPSHRLGEFLSVYGNSVTAKVLILGNSDQDFNEPIHGLPSSIKKVFCQNLMFEDSRYQVIPIGIENLRLAKNGIVDLFKPTYFNMAKHEKILVGPFGLTHPERNELLSANYGHTLIENHFKRMSPKKYARLSSSFRYVAVPRGNGMDTHRFWETLYRGGIPVVKKSSWSKQIAALQYPIIELESWDQEVILNELDKYHVNDFSRDIPILWWPWWEDLIRKSV